MTSTGPHQPGMAALEKPVAAALARLQEDLHRVADEARTLGAEHGACGTRCTQTPTGLVLFAPSRQAGQAWKVIRAHDTILGRFTADRSLEMVSTHVSTDEEAQILAVVAEQASALLDDDWFTATQTWVAVRDAEAKAEDMLTRLEELLDGAAGAAGALRAAKVAREPDSAVRAYAQALISRPDHPGSAEDVLAHARDVVVNAAAADATG